MTWRRRESPPVARTLLERYCPDTGVPLHLGRVWPPRLVVHHVTTKPQRDGHANVTAQVWVRHVFRDNLQVRLRPSDEPAVDSDGRTVGGLEVVQSQGVVAASSEALGVPRPRGEVPDPGFHPLPLTLRWTARFANDVQGVVWVRKVVLLELTDGRSRRTFQWPVYLTPSAAEVPGRASAFDDHPHFCWVDDSDGPLRREGVSRSWIELPAPCSAPLLPPACWVQPSARPPRRGAGPEEVELVAVFPVEGPSGTGLEQVGWDGSLGGAPPPPTQQALAVDSEERGGAWKATLAYWDVRPDDVPGPVAQARPTPLEAPTSCVWPELLSADDHSLVLYDLNQRGDGSCEVVVDFRVAIPPDAEALRLQKGVVRLGADEVGAWEDGPAELHALAPASLRCTLDMARLRGVADGRLKLTLVTEGRPTRGVVRGDHLFRTTNGPYVRLSRARVGEQGVRTPWLSIDLGTEGSCAAVAFMDGFAPRVISTHFDAGPVTPSRVYLSPALGGVYSLAEGPSEDALYTTLVKLGLRFGDGAHPGCPDHIAATEVARFFLKRFLLEVRERMAWFPLEHADVLVSFPPRLAAMPRFVRSLRDTFQSVLEEVVWPRGAPKRLVFREEAFLVSVPVLYRDLQLDPAGPSRSRFYWVMDFGGGTTDVCGFLVQPDDYGEEHVVSRMTYPQRLAHHLSGNDVTRAFYAALYHHLLDVDSVTGPDVSDASGEDAVRFPLPPDPLPSARSAPTALLNQTALRELADAIKCLDPARQDRSVRAVAQTLGSPLMRRADGSEATLVGLLTTEAAHLGDLTAADLHAEVLDPAARLPVASRAIQRPVRLDPRRQTRVRCRSCSTVNALPQWLFAANGSLTFRCRECGSSQRAQLVTRQAEVPADAPPQEQERSDAARDAVANLDLGTAGGELYLQQDGQTYVLKDAETLARWVQERRVGPHDLLSEDGMSWTPLQDLPELRELFQAARVVGVDTTQEVPRSRYRDMMFPEPEEGAEPVERPMLGRDIRLFLAACAEALEAAVRDLPEPDDTEVVVLVAGRASQFQPIAEGVRAFLPGRVVHLTNEWVRSAFGTGGQIDAGAGLKTLTANGGGLFALLQSNPDTSHLKLSFDTSLMDCPVYLQSAASARPWLLSERLDLRPGGRMPLVVGAEEDQAEPDAPGERAAEPPPRALPVDTPLTGDLRLVVDGLPEDRTWEPYVTIAQGTARRKHGRRARTLPETELRNEDRSFVLGPLTHELEVSFIRMLPGLPLLGAEQDEESEP